jgi:anti-sigma B factor antagonist
LANAFTVRQSIENGISVLTLDGFLDAHTAPHFEQAIQREMEAARFRIVVDCAGLTYISSAGLGVFMSFIEEIREAGGDIRICAVIPKVKQVFDILGFTTLFDVVDDVPQAVARFGEPAGER